MDAERRAEITGWDAREFSDGFAGLGRLVDRGFSGAVTNGTGWLFVFEGRVVGTADADLDAFADASGTIYKAPAEVLPVLFAMQEQGGEPRAQYYTNDTPLSEADRKLSQGGFTGYVELSENVLSGDYYVTYTAGESMAAAYVGNSRRLETDDDAFELADEEVGIYTVYEVDLDVRDIPDPEATDDATGVADKAVSEDDPAEDETVEDESVESETDEGEITEDEPVRDATPDDATPDDATPDDATPDEKSTDEKSTDEKSTDDEGPTPDARNDRERDEERPDRGGSEPTPRGASTRSDEAPPSPRERAGESNGAEATTDTTGEDIESAEPIAERDATTGDATTERAATADTSDAHDTPEASESEGNHPNDDVFSEEEQWREQKSIPALDPSEASDPPGSRSRDETDPNAGGRSASEANDRRRSGSADRGGDIGSTAAPVDGRSPEPRSTERDRSNRSAVSQRASGSSAGERVDERVEKLETALEAATQERESLEAERDSLATDRDEIADERDTLATEVDRLESELSTLREERDRLKSELSAARDRLPESDRTISAAEARSGTNLFVRYESKGGATLEDAHDGAVDRDALRENLRIEHHTSFETDGLAVDGQPFEEFLADTIEYGFTRWLVEDLPFEVSSTGNQSVLRDLYDALPEIDRAEIGGSVSLAIRENGEETREQRSFDLVLRDRMGNPLFVADLNDSRDPTAEGALESLVENGRDIAESNEPFAAAFAVTESFFEPGALETASDAVGGGLFSRSKRASFVKLSRKQGYHLCLVEARDGGFHMTVPDL
jgi:outer membrane murein-binding lipoprotein Lpp